MTQDELKIKIAKIKKAIAAEKEGSEDRVMMEGFLKKLEAQLEPEKKEEPKVEKPKAEAKKKVTIKKKVEPKAEKPDPKFKVGDEVFLYVDKKGFSHSKTKSDEINIKKSGDIKKVTWQPERNTYSYQIDYDGGFLLTEEDSLTLNSKHEASKSSSKDLEIEKGDKKETHKFDTSFDKDIKDAVITLNKHRFVVREIKNKTTKKVDKVHHSPEYRNAKTIQSRVEQIFNSSVFDIAKTKKEKTEKKPIIEVINKIKDLHTLWLNEIDLIINNEDQKELETIANLMEGLIKQAHKNDGADKWQSAGGLAEIAKKYSL